MAVRTAHLIEELLTTLHFGIVQITCLGHTETTVPNAEGIVVFIRHLFATVPRCGINDILLIVGAHLRSVSVQTEELVDKCLDTVCRTIAIVGMKQRREAAAFSLDGFNHISILAHGLSPSCGGVEIVTVGTGHVGDVPYCVATRAIEQCGTCHTVGVFLNTFLTICQRVPSSVCPVVSGMVPHGGVQLSEASFALVLNAHRVLTDGVDKTRTVHTDSGFEAHLIVGGQRFGIERRLGYLHVRIREFVSFAIRELIAVLIRCILPRNGDALLVNRCFEGVHSLSLRHTRHFCDVRVSSIGLAVSVDTCRWVINHEQVAVAHLVSVVLRLTLSVTVRRVTEFATRADPSWTKSPERTCKEVGVVFKEILAILKRDIQTSHLNSGGRI